LSGAFRDCRTWSSTDRTFSMTLYFDGRDAVYCLVKETLTLRHHRDSLYCETSASPAHDITILLILPWRAQWYKTLHTNIPLICDNNSVTTQYLWFFFREQFLKGFWKCCNFLWVQRRHNRSPAASFANCVMTLHLPKVHLQTFSFYTSNSKNAKFWSCDTLVTNERYIRES